MQDPLGLPCRVGLGLTDRPGRAEDRPVGGVAETDDLRRGLRAEAIVGRTRDVAAARMGEVGQPGLLEQVDRGVLVGADGQPGTRVGQRPGRRDVSTGTDGV